MVVFTWVQTYKPNQQQNPFGPLKPSKIETARSPPTLSPREAAEFLRHPGDRFATAGS